MGKEMTNELGQINISDEVIGVIAGVAAMECYGLANRNIQDGISELLKIEHFSRGVEVSVVDDLLTIDLYVIVEYGTNITEVAHNIIEKVKYTVERLVGVKVKTINVRVQGVRVTKQALA